MGVQGDDLLVAGDRGSVVDQHPHPHTAISGPQQSVGKESASLITTKDEVLKIQCLLGGIYHLCTDQKSVNADGYDAKRRIASVCDYCAGKLLSETGFLGMDERNGDGFWKAGAWRKRRASAQ